MQYKTIVSELLEQYPRIYQELISSRTLLSTMDQMASQLRSHHLQIIIEISQAADSRSELQIQSEALEIALSWLKEQLAQREQAVLG